jgi:hypothetical protein
VRDAETGRMLPQKFDERFWAKVAVVPGDGCWEWTASRVGRNRPGGGYGQFWCSEKQTQLKAHRVAWEQANGPIPAGMLVCHRCDNPGCVRPDHLFLGTPKDNTVDMVQKGRDWKHAGALCPRAILTESQVREIRRKYVHGVYGYKRLGAEYGVNPNTIERIVKLETWRELAP